MRSIFITIVGVWLALPTLAQDRIRNVRMRALDADQVEIQYDLRSMQAGDSVYFDIRSRIRGTLLIDPKFVQGDVGTGVTAGSNRRIVWNARANGYTLENEEVQAIVRVKTAPAPATAKAANRREKARKSAKEAAPAPVTEPVAAAPAPVKPSAPTGATTPPPVEATTTAPAPATTPSPATDAPILDNSNAPVRQKRRYAGPAWALVSAVLPGVGNIFVQQPKPKISYRPAITVAAYGLLFYGLSERQKANDAYAIYQQQKNRDAAEPYYTEANGHHQRYFLATRGAVAIAAIDVVLTALRGFRNQRAARPPKPVTVHPGLQAGQPIAVLRYSF